MMDKDAPKTNLKYPLSNAAYDAQRAKASEQYGGHSSKEVNRIADRDAKSQRKEK
jgi:hypothetical protein